MNLNWSDKSRILTNVIAIYHPVLTSAPYLLGERETPKSVFFKEFNFLHNKFAMSTL